ncbi:MAG: TonB-dependent receptor [Caulobacteraceae bacterium]|nr:MAG: TonB-dependent receptor [Caulobacteraceae bacterium]
MPFMTQAMRALCGASVSALTIAVPLSARAGEIERDTAVETIIVIGARPTAPAEAVVVEPARAGRLATLPDLFAASPGVLVQSTFGGIDHPRLSIRGSGLQRGTMPAGRGVELRLDGLPMTYADTSFDFVEWIEPLATERVVVLRGGRGALDAATSLGGLIDFESRTGRSGSATLLRGEAGSFGATRAQASIGAAGEALDGYASASWFAQDGYRDFNAQEAARANANTTLALSPTTRLTAGLLYSDSELELPGPLTLAQIDAGSRAAQPGNVAGDWRRFAERTRLSLGVESRLAGADVRLAVGHMATDVEFRRRDVQVEDNADWSLSAGIGGALDLAGEGAGWELSFIGQHGERDVQQYLNGGGTIPTFTGDRGLLWADNDLTATRATIAARVDLPVTDRISFDGAVAYNRHTRKIDENFPTRAARPAAVLDTSYEATTALGLVAFAANDEVDVFVAASRTHEPPTWDVLLVNANGAGAGAVLVNGANPRRPVVAMLDDQVADTLEVGARGRMGPARFDVTLYRSWIENEIVSTTDPVTQTVATVGNADRTRRWGVEAIAEATIARDLFGAGDELALAGVWTWTDARFESDPFFGDNQLPIVPEHMFQFNLDYRHANGVFAAVSAEIAPDGGFADYANTVQADGHATLGLRLGWEGERFTVFADGRNITDERYVSTVIAAQNNLNGADNATFAPGEGAAVTVGIEVRF